METHLRTELVLAALEMAYAQRAPCQKVIFHSDHGTQYTSVAFGQRCEELGVRPSMGLDRRCIRQRSRGELLRQPGMRGARSKSLQDTRGSPYGGLLLDRGLVQPPPSSFVPGIPVAKAVRTGVRVPKLRASDAFASDCPACKIDESIEIQDSTSEHEEDIHQPNHSLTKDRPPNRDRSTPAPDQRGSVTSRRRSTLGPARHPPYLG